MKPANPKRKTPEVKRKSTAPATSGPLVKHPPSPGGHLENDWTVTIAASVPQSVAIAGERRAGAGNFSRFVSSALQHELACSALDELVGTFVADGGEIDEALVSAARKLIRT